MFGLGVWEIAVILAVALVVLGPKRLPKVAKQMGRTLREFRRAASDFQVSLEQEADAEERKARTPLPAPQLPRPPEPIEPSIAAADSDAPSASDGPQVDAPPTEPSTSQSTEPAQSPDEDPKP